MTKTVIKVKLSEKAREQAVRAGMPAHTPQEYKSDDPAIAIATLDAGGGAEENGVVTLTPELILDERPIDVAAAIAAIVAGKAALVAQATAEAVAKAAEREAKIVAGLAKPDKDWIDCAPYRPLAPCDIRYMDDAINDPRVQDRLAQVKPIAEQKERERAVAKAAKHAAERAEEKAAEDAKQAKAQAERAALLAWARDHMPKDVARIDDDTIPSAEIRNEIRAWLHALVGATPTGIITEEAEEPEDVKLLGECFGGDDFRVTTDTDTAERYSRDSHALLTAFRADLNGLIGLPPFTGIAASVTVQRVTYDHDNCPGCYAKLVREEIEIVLTHLATGTESITYWLPAKAE